MKKLFSLFLLLSLIFFGSTQAQAKMEAIPDLDGDYQDPNNKDLRVRVFVHKVKEDFTVTPVCVDDDSPAPVAVTGWKLPTEIGYKINLSTVPVGVGSGNWKNIVDSSFLTWSMAMNNRVIFRYVGETRTNKQAGDMQNILAWGRTSGNALAVTYTRYNTSTKQVVDVDTIMNQKFAWSWSNVCGLNSYDAQNILTHELGHWMGLDDHYTAAYTENTMYGYGAKGEIKKNTLTTGDIAGLLSVYK